MSPSTALTLMHLSSGSIQIKPVMPMGLELAPLIRMRTGFGHVH
jgi:hypothetical protein